MDLADALEKLKFDKRMKDWNVRQGVISEQDFEKHLKDLKDNVTESEQITLEDK